MDSKKLLQGCHHEPPRPGYNGMSRRGLVSHAQVNSEASYSAHQQSLIFRHRLLFVDIVMWNNMLILASENNKKIPKTLTVSWESK